MTPAILVCAVLAMHDGDSGRCNGRPIRLAGIDAGEVAPFTRCRTRADEWACSAPARAHAYEARDLARRASAEGARCIDTGERSWRRIVARCTVNGRDLGGIIVRAGLAISDRDFGDQYRSEQNAARRERLGVWE